jgi:site-specific recombinase XerD
MGRAVDLPGAAHMVMADGVRYLDPAPAVFGAILQGWETQQLSRFLDHDATIKPRLSVVRRFADFSGQYPWQWEPAEVEAFFAHLRNRVVPLALSTGRAYQNALRMFCTYVTDGRYGWQDRCVEMFGQAPVQILHEWNTLSHLSDFEGRPGRRPLTYDEVQQLFDAADARVGVIRARRRKGALPALRDAAVLKVIYAYGLRRSECWGLDLADRRHNPKAAGLGQYGALFVRFGKAAGGGAARRRTVMTVPEMDWVAEVAEDYLMQVRPLFGARKHPALWLTERGGRLSRRALDDAFTAARDAAGLSDELDMHCLRHSYITHLIEFGYPAKFVQDQVGHVSASTTAIYTGVSDEFRNQLIRTALQERHADLW